MRPNLKSGRVCYTLGLLSFHRILVSRENCNPLIKVGWWKIEKVSYTLSLLMKTDFPFYQTNLSESESPIRPQNSIWRSNTGSNRYFPKTTINKCKEIFISTITLVMIVSYFSAPKYPYRQVLMWVLTHSCCCEIMLRCRNIVSDQSSRAPIFPQQNEIWDPICQNFGPRNLVHVFYEMQIFDHLCLV